LRKYWFSCDNKRQRLESFKQLGNLDQKSQINKSFFPHEIAGMLAGWSLFLNL